MHPHSQSDQGEIFESLETRLRDLPPLPVPCGLEARLLAAIPAENVSTSAPGLRAPRKSKAVWVGVAIAGMAACFLMMILEWPNFGDDETAQQPAANSENSESAHESVAGRSQQRLNIVSRLEARRSLVRVERQPFEWPIPEESTLMASSKFPDDLLD